MAWSAILFKNVRVNFVGWNRMALIEFSHKIKLYTYLSIRNIITDVRPAR